jgi:hypothetical protein
MAEARQSIVLTNLSTNAGLQKEALPIPASQIRNEAVADHCWGFFQALQNPGLAPGLCLGPLTPSYIFPTAYSPGMTRRFWPSAIVARTAATRPRINSITGWARFLEKFKM